MALCAVVFFTLVLGTIGVAAGAAMKKSKIEMKRAQPGQTQQLQHFNTASNRLRNSLGTASNQQPLPAFPIAMQGTVTGGSSAQQRQYELALSQQREAEARKAIDQAQRDRNVREAERQRDLSKAKEERLQQVQNAIDSDEVMIRKARDANVSSKVWQDQRDSLLKEKAKLQGY